MIRYILIWLAVIIVLLLVALWFITGGVGKTMRAAQGIGNAVDLIFRNGTTTGPFRLPWQPDEIVRGPQVIDIPDSVDDPEAEMTPEEELERTRKEYEAVQKAMQDAKTFGEPSPYRGAVQIGAGSAPQATGSKEFLVLEASGDMTAPINITGWSLQSALTGVRAFVPRGAELFILGDLQVQENMYLAPEALAFVSSGFSPIGTSFRENTCTGYLASLRDFTPALSRECPSAGESLPLTPENVRTYGDACFDVAHSLPSCAVPLTIPGNISPACRIFLANNLSYNGCVQTHRSENDFTRTTWRIYLNATGELWRNSHDIVRLLDSEGRTVDVLTY